MAQHLGQQPLRAHVPRPDDFGVVDFGNEVLRQVLGAVCFEDVEE